MQNIKILLAPGIWLGPKGETDDPDKALVLDLKGASKKLALARKKKPYPMARFSARRSLYV